MTVTHLKAVYRKGEMLEHNDGYSIMTDPEYSLLSDLSNSERIYGLSVKYPRVNRFGYGTTLANPTQTAVSLSIRPRGTDNPISEKYAVKIGDVISVSLRLSDRLSAFTMSLADRASQMRVSADMDDIIKNLIFNLMRERFYTSANGGSADRAFNANDFQSLNFYYWDSTDELFLLTFNSTRVTVARTCILNYFKAGIEVGQTDPYSYTWYQLQHAIYSKCTTKTKAQETYLTPEAAKEWGIANLPDGYTAYGEETEE